MQGLGLGLGLGLCAAAALLAAAADPGGGGAGGVRRPAPRGSGAIFGEDVSCLLHTKTIPQANTASWLDGCYGHSCLQRYVDMPDGTFSWEDTGMRFHGRDADTASNWTAYVLNVTSQRWLGESIVRFPVWWHTLVVVVPGNLEIANFATLHLDLGIDSKGVWQMPLFNRADVEGFDLRSTSQQRLLTRLSRAAAEAIHLATHTRAVAACLLHTLNEFQVYVGDPRHNHLVADWLIGYSMRDFLEHPDEPARLVHLPMVKAAVRAMDALTLFSRRTLGSSIDRFALLGSSKMALATWMAGSVDERVEAIVPVNYPLARFMATNATLDTILRHWNLTEVPAYVARSPPSRVGGLDRAPRQRGAAGLQAMALLGSPYEQLQPFERTAQFVKMAAIHDPVNYMEKLGRVRKFMVLDTNDVWFETSSILGRVAFWWPVLPGPKSLLFLKGSHETTLVQALSPIAAFLRGHLLGQAAPEVAARFDRTSRLINVEQEGRSEAPLSVTLWSGIGGSNGDLFQARYKPEALASARPAARDFALQPPGVANSVRKVLVWTKELPALSPNSSIGAFVELSFAGPAPGTDAYRVSTPLWVLSA